MRGFLFALRPWSSTGIHGHIPIHGYKSEYVAARMQEKTGIDPVAAVEPELAAPWDPRSQPREVVWPLTIRVGAV